jgi:hypothetical protein
MRLAHARAFSLALALATSCTGGDRDGGRSEPQPVAGSECTRNGVCDDGVFCNGEERCEDGKCAAGDPVVCDDGIACTADVCDEVAWACRHAAADADSDGHGDAACLDARSRPLGDDCDDADAARHPGADEQCDSAGIDEDCDPSTVGVRDEDGDGVTSSACCNVTIHDRQCATDCDDTNPTIGPDATEVCDGLDNDCDGRSDEGAELRLFRDADGDGYGTDAATLGSCVKVAGYSSEDGDCDDDDPSIHPGAPEGCESPAVDRDCNGRKNDFPGGCACETGSKQRCALPGLCGKGVLSCVNQTWTACSIGPVPELCNGLDDDCDGQVDNGVAIDCYEDDDGDGYAAAGAEATSTCPSEGQGACPDGYTSRAPSPVAVDCAPKDATVSPGADELCNGKDDNCNGAVDEGLPTTRRFVDADGDAHPGTAAERCAGDPTSESDADDCMDNNPLVYPGQNGVFANPACGRGSVPCRLSEDDWRCRPAGSDDCSRALDAARWDYDCDGAADGEPLVSDPCLDTDVCGDGCGPSGFLAPSSGTPSCGTTQDYQICRCLGAQGGGCAGSTERRAYPCR